MNLRTCRTRSFAERGTVFLLRITRLSVGRRATGFVVVAKWRVISCVMVDRQIGVTHY